tara:strand:+ start:27085 stop:27879 length:795 start_codon:yes stop_codon:yes gene_type:complete
MQKKFDFGTSDIMTVTKETIKGFVIDCGTQVAAGTLSAIADLKNINLKYSVTRRGGTEKVMFSGYLNELLTGLYAQSVKYQLQLKPFGLTHKFFIDFLGGILELHDGDEFKVELQVNASAFTSLDVTKSYVQLHTIPAVGKGTLLPVVVSHALENGATYLDKKLGDNVHKIVAAMDFTADYTASAKAKFINQLSVIGKDYKRTLTPTAIEAENVMYFDDNPESSVAQLVVFWEPKLINDVSIKGTFDMGVDASARILVVHQALI